MNNIVDYAKIAVIGFIGIFVINKVLKKVGMTQFTTSNS